ncbi:MAG: hypothetical protein HN929_10735, partial [Chloroflexi bacterium]|nr:hypothetical protein [Chloroflexota bacterium]
AFVYGSFVGAGSPSVLLETGQGTRIKGHITNTDTSVTNVALYDCLDTEFDLINIDSSFGGKIRNCEFSSDVTISAGTYEVDSTSLTQMQAQTEDFTGATINRFDGDFAGNVNIAGDLEVSGSASVLVDDVITGDLSVGKATENSVPVFKLIGDADSDAGGAITSETLQITLTPAADPTDAVWAMTNTQSAISLSTVANANQLYLATDGKVGIGTASPLGNLDISVNGFSQQYLSSYASNVSANGRMFFIKSSSNVIGTPAATAADESLGSLIFQGVNSAGTPALSTAVNILVTQAGATDATNIGGQLEIHTAVKGSAPSLSTKVHDDAMLDLYGGTISILAGAEDGAKTRSAGSNTVKYMRFAMPHYNQTIPEEPMAVIQAFSSATNNVVDIGGGAGTLNTATVIRMFTDDDQTTLTGTEVARFEGGATKASMMGLGNSALRAWSSGFDVLQVGIKGALWGTHADGASTSTFLSNNLYYDGAYKYIGTTSDEASSYEQTSGGHIFTTYAAGTIGNGVTGEVAALTIANDASSTFGGDVIMADEKSIQTGTTAADFFSLETYNTNDASRSVAIRVDNSAVASDTALIGFYGATPVNQPKKADNNNWTNISDIATALAELGLIDAA